MTVAEMQKRVGEFTKNNGLEASPEFLVLDVVSELGEVAKEVLKMTSYGKHELVFREEVKGELGDALYSLITVANTLDVDLTSAVEGVLEKYERRLKNGSAGSESEDGV